MNTISKILFWFFTIAVGFVNPLISFGLIILYYLPGIISSLCDECKDSRDEIVYEEYTEHFEKPTHEFSQYSDDTREKMK